LTPSPDIPDCGLQAAAAAARGGRRALSSAVDKVLLKGLVFHGYHGVLDEVRGGHHAYCHRVRCLLCECPSCLLLRIKSFCVQERRLGQKFMVDATLTTDLREAGRSDDLGHTIDYAAVYRCEALRACMEVKSSALAFSAAHRPRPPLFFLAPAQLFYRDIQAEVEGPPRKLIETVAERIAAGILAQHGRVHSVRVGICKPHVAVAGVVQSLGVEITRRRGQN